MQIHSPMEKAVYQRANWKALRLLHIYFIPSVYVLQHPLERQESKKGSRTAQLHQI